MTNNVKTECITPDTYVVYWQNYKRCIVCKRELRDELHLHNHYKRYHWKDYMAFVKIRDENLTKATKQGCVSEIEIKHPADAIRYADNILHNAGFVTYSTLLESMEYANKIILQNKPHSPTTPTNHIQRHENETLVDYVSRYMEAYL